MRRTLAYEAIFETLRNAIEMKSLPEGTVLLEGPIATIFDSSRSPVKQALAKLESEGLVRRFDGRGVLVGMTSGPLRLKVTPEMLSLEADPAGNPKVFAWQNFYYDFEKTVILRAVFGAARINELALARYYNVGRTVAGDILNYAAKTGIVIKDDKSRWWINPLDEERFHNLYALRILLEPAALKSAIDRIPPISLEVMRNRLIETTDHFPRIEPAELDALEEDLHIGLMQFSDNSEILEALKRTRCVLVAGKHIQRAVRGAMPIDAFMHEHLEIMDAAAALDFKTAEAALIEHLATSSRKANERLAAYVQSHQVSPIEYVLE